MKRYLSIFALLVYFTGTGAISFAADSRLADLDKAPEGAHKGQMLVSFFFLAGQPLGDMVSAEEDFLNDSTYTFSDSGTIKELKVSHIGFALGGHFEYMFFDYVGSRVRLKHTRVLQRTVFGGEYENWSGTLYWDFSFYIGPSIHFTNRKKWDVSFTPLIGYALAKVQPTPIADELISGYTGPRTQSINTITYGAELAGSYFFSSGLYLSLGLDWTMIPIDFGKDLNLTNGSNTYLDGESSTSLQVVSLYFSIGYAFSH